MVSQMNRDYLDLYQDDAGDIGFSASPRSEADADRANREKKPLAYSGKVKKGGSKPRKNHPRIWGSEGRIVRDPTGGRTDGGDRLPPPAG